MRIACVHVPQFALQSLGRIDPSLRGAAVAVVGAGAEPAAGMRSSLALHSPIVLACSRAAWAAGVRLGMTATAARFASSDVRVVAADGPLERETVRAIADALLGASAIVDTGGRIGAGGAHLAMYCEVPSKVRGMSFGARLVDLLDSLGIAARIGIADDRFTAWVAAAHGGGDGSAGSARDDRGVVSVPRGGSAAFLAPRPLSLLAITPEVQHMLESLGVRTLGEFAALPAPSVSRPLEADYQALARGDSGSALRPYTPEGPIREQLVVGTADNLFSGASAATTLAERLALRLAGRGRAAARIELAITGEAGGHTVPITAAAVTTPDALAELLGRWVNEAPGAITRLGAVVVTEAIVGAPAPAIAAEAAGAEAAPPIDALSAALSASLSAAGTRPLFARSAAHADLAAPAAHDRSLPWQLSAPQSLRAERRDAHRRTRRARQRRRPAALAQPQLFGQLDG
jgi:hypothetical protein